MSATATGDAKTAGAARAVDQGRAVKAADHVEPMISLHDVHKHYRLKGGTGVVGGVGYCSSWLMRFGFSFCSGVLVRLK